ncbi:MAG: hypothetical protein A2W11_01230 [Ignavibacteria bacterium RBG_16_35_7]|nr:MAG: hypothetical protein A2W11_01230 [Ignavibacteria bacterium RBG_16_35_7]
MFLINDSFELEDVPEPQRDSVLKLFFNAINCIKNYPDILYATQELHTRNFSFGNIYELLYGSWSKIKSIPTLRGISSTTLNYYHHIMFATPNLFNEIASKEVFDEQFASEHHGYSGIDYLTHPSPYVKCEISWNEWKCSWLQNHQHEVSWVNVNDEFLPNKKFSDEIIWKEVEVHSKHLDLNKYSGNRTSAFYEEIMKKKGPATAAYSRQVGSRIAKTNYYKLEKELSNKERKISGNSLRTIFSLIGSNGKIKYISIDHKHGMFEYHNHKGDHLGEFRFDGTPNSGVDPSHSLKTLR